MKPTPQTDPAAADTAARAPLRTPMSRALRAAIFLVCAALWLTGALWLLADRVFPAHNDFGALPNPWEAPLMRVHGLVAVGAVFLLGMVSASHVLVRWAAGANRASGLWLLAWVLLLVLSGYALYYTTGTWHAGASASHTWLGLASLAVALTHWLGVPARPAGAQRSVCSTTSSGSLTK